MTELYADVELPTPGSIRLLQIEPYRVGKVKCRLRAFPLDKEPGYIALSYAWRSPMHMSTDPAGAAQADRECEIECNGRSFLVLENIHNALVRISQVESLQKQYIWADAISINQADLQERAEQINMMATIYSKAQGIAIWLGPGDDYVRPAADLIQCLSQLDKAERLLVHPKRLKDPVVQAILHQEYHKLEYWKALARLFCRAWFRRAWVIQEVLLAGKLTVLCGEHELSWERLVLVSAFLAKSAWSREFAKPAFFAIDKTLDGVEFYNRNRMQPHLNGPTKLNTAKRTLMTNSVSDNQLLLGLIRSRRYSSFDPKDKVFSLYDIARKHGRHPELIPQPNYTWTEGKAYFETALAVLKGSNDLLLLAYAEGDVFRNSVMIGWPSWVPDWSVTDIVGLGVTGYRRFSAAKERKRELDFRENERVLGIEAAELDTVTYVGESKRDVDHTRCFAQWLDIVLSLNETYVTGESRMDAFWRCLITDTCECDPSPHHPARQTHRTDFRHWLLEAARLGEASQDKTFTEKLSKLRRVDASDLIPSEIEISRAVDTNEDSHENEFDTSFDTLFSLARCLRLFRTKQSFLGLGTESVMSGDSIWIVSGSRVPLILRKKPGSLDGRFELVGATYLHGFMHGEALDRESFVFRKIEIT